MKVALKISICLLFNVISIISWAQSTNDSDTFYRAKLIGKKWSMNKDVNGHAITFSFIFDNDSVTNIITDNDRTITLRYAYYFSEFYQDEFDESAVGMTTCGKWFYYSRYDKDNTILHRDEVQTRIFALDEDKFSFGKSPEYQMILTAEPLDK